VVGCFEHDNELWIPYTAGNFLTRCRTVTFLNYTDMKFDYSCDCLIHSCLLQVSAAHCVLYVLNCVPEYKNIAAPAFDKVKLLRL
jgi:hypothetical protein